MVQKLKELGMLRFEKEKMLNVEREGGETAGFSWKPEVKKWE